MPEDCHLSNLIRLRKTLQEPCDPGPLPGITIRTFNGSDDVDAWLAIREAAFADLLAMGRPWTADDFHREFLGKPWWRPESMWFATQDMQGVRAKPVGTIILGRAGRPPHDLSSVQWLMVVPEAQRRGIGRLLLAVLEAAAWNMGARELTLETHASWSAAVRLYRACDYSDA